MRNYLIGTVLLAALLLLAPGCDRIRASLGKPTSADLAVLRAQKEQREQAVRDSLEAAAAEQARIAAGQVAAAAAAAETPVLRRYYAVAGAFKDPSGAQVYADKLQENGFRVRLFDFKSGLKVVCVEGSDTLDAVRRDVSAIKKLGLSGTDPWIYNTTQKLHKEL
ncbi:MAG: hypothetical protein IJ636_07730 [Bacteroidales bacterium]|nr:hypothetical protein [Bacteroidales bacterium]